ncbi:NAD-dependent epimerase/dehydratase family protein [Rhizosaccharibacter radicis]|uniref:NAD-dependent epimerase/dehydratase family protein n=1 Tax=Rhizosaccharibacter radicis TaxID=2782605 RepID=A0ABT1VZY6_9PROT|nr:NAD-dependent epimerase/dehydratase family protein [Acetobacteraceae bacterium KSS12]
MTILVTGGAGFIGYHVSAALLARGERVVAVDDLNSYYDPVLKQARLDRLARHPAFRFVRLDLADREALASLFAVETGIEAVVHLAAQAGVRYSLVDPYAYVQANVLGHVTLLEMARRLPRLRHLVFASSSSVYGLNDVLPFREDQAVDRPNSLYAATKRSGELIAHAYGHIYGIPQSGLRFFTVYGPWGRPDMAYYSFARCILEGRPITLYEGDGLSRDFTFIDDVVAGVLQVLDVPPVVETRQEVPLRVLNLGNRRPEPVRKLVGLLEKELGRDAVIQQAPRPASDLERTWASVEAVEELVGWRPNKSLDEGIPRFVSWFRDYHGVG